MCVLLFSFFFFKQKTAYEMRISDWSSDVCSSDLERFFQTYFTTFPGKYTTGDGARRDEDGYYWITGRVDDVINVSGHRMGTAEVESAQIGRASCRERVCQYV